MREWQDYPDHLDYEELRKREEARLAAIEAKRRADDAVIDARRHKAMKVLSSIAATLAVVAVVYAIAHQTTSPSYNQPVIIRNEFSADLTGQIAAPEMGPGDEISYDPIFTNTGNVPMYAFIRFDCATYNSDSGDKAIYEFTPSDDVSGMWTQVESDNPGQLLFAYTESDSEMKEVKPNQEISLTGTLKMVADNGSLAKFTDEDVGFQVTGCAIDTLGSIEPDGAYNEYIAAGGE